MLQGNAGEPEVFELPASVHGRRIKDDVVVYMGPVRVSCHNEGVPALREAHCQLMTETVGFLRRNFPGFERLPDLVGDYVPVLVFPSDLRIQAFLQHEFLINRHRITAIGSHKFALFCLLRILRIVCPGTKASGNRASSCCV